MRRNVLIIFFAVICLTGCIGRSESNKILMPDNQQSAKSSRPERDLTIYNDDFRDVNENQWDFAQLTYSEDQLVNFKRAEMKYVDGYLVIETQKGFFSKAGYESKFTLSGDFDIEIDCKMHFNKNLSGMEERAVFSIGERDNDWKNASFAWIQLLNKPGWSDAIMDASAVVNNKFQTKKKVKISKFDGSLRFLREANELTMLYRTKNSLKWVNLAKVKYSTKNMKITFYAANFTLKLKSIDATKNFKAEFDEFRINAAYDVIESDI